MSQANKQTSSQLPSSLRYGISLQTKLNPENWNMTQSSSEYVTVSGAEQKAPTEEEKTLFENSISSCLAYVPHTVFDQQNKELCAPAVITLPNEGTVHITFDDNAHFARLFFSTNKNAQVSVVLEQTQSVATNLALHCMVAEGANVTFFIKHAAKRVGYMQTTATVAEGAHVEWNEIAIGSEQLLTNTVNILQGRKAQADIYAALVHQNADVYYATVHDAPDTSSNMVIKGLAGNSGRVVQRGLVKINKSGTNCDGYQQTHLIKLDSTTQAHALPQLEIDNNDVKCSHGATISQLDHDQVFYLMSRGLTKQESRHLLVEGFIADITKRVVDVGWNDELSAAAHNLLE